MPQRIEARISWQRRLFRVHFTFASLQSICTDVHGIPRSDSQAASRCLSAPLDRLSRWLMLQPIWMDKSCRQNGQTELLDLRPPQAVCNQVNSNSACSAGHLSLEQSTQAYDRKPATAASESRLRSFATASCLRCPISPCSPGYQCLSVDRILQVFFAAALERAFYHHLGISIGRP